ncbi:MAG: glycosyltransferase [Pseudomonadota bacterium]
MNPGVAIFRKRLLAYSETFIAQQGHYLPNYRHLFCGLSRQHSGKSLLNDSPQALLCDHTRYEAIAKLAFRAGFGTAKGWLHQLKEFQPSLIHAHFFNDGLDAARLATALDVPLVTTLHGHDISKHERARSRDRKTRHFFERVDKVIAVSDFIAEQALASGCPEDKLVQHYIGIDLANFTHPKSESDEPSLLFVGRLTEKKGATYLLQAMQKIQADFPGLTLTVVGDGDLRDSLEAEARERDLKAAFVGTQSPEQIRQRLTSCWLFVAPSVQTSSGDAEGLGMVFLEAQASQTPVVSFDSGGVSEAVAHEQSGLLAPERDVDTLADHMRTLLTDAGKRRTMGAYGRVRVTERFDINQQCETLEQIYDVICD